MGLEGGSLVYFFALNMPATLDNKPSFDGEGCWSPIWGVEAEGVELEGASLRLSLVGEGDEDMLDVRVEAAEEADFMKTSPSFLTSSSEMLCLARRAWEKEETRRWRKENGGR